MGRRALALKCDVTDREQVAATVARTVEELGSLDILVNTPARSITSDSSTTRAPTSGSAISA